MKISTVIKIAAVTAAVSTNPAAWSQDHPAAAMLKPPADEAQPLTAPVFNSGFTKAYIKAGKPKIAIFWDRKFSDQLSEWQANSRVSAQAEAAYTHSKKHLGTQKNTQQDHTESGYLGVEGSLSAQQRLSDYSRGGIKKSDFGFASGFTRRLLQSSVRVVDRETILRLADRQNTSAGSRSMSQSSDYQKVETDALTGFADYLAEIIFVDDSEAPLGKSFQITVKAITSGEIVAMLQTTGEAAATTAPKKTWVAGPRGFSQVSSNTALEPSQAGAEVANNMMQALASYWR